MARILVIDDENNIRLMVRLALQSAGHETETASDGLEGLEKFAQGENFDAVLLDQRMPGMDGLDVLREMRRRNSTARVVMISAFGTIDLATEAVQAGAMDFLRKPFTTEALRNAVQSAIEAPSACEKTMPCAAIDGASINGFRITSSTRTSSTQGSEISGNDGAIRCFFSVQHAQNSADANSADVTCEVVLPRYLVEAVKAHADREKMPDEQHFWLWLCEESLANYLWQNAEMPPQNTLRIEEISTGLRRWIDAMAAR